MAIRDYSDVAPRRVQDKIYSDFRAAWGQGNSCYVVRAPVAAGKSHIGMTIGRWCAEQFGMSVTITTPNYELQGQYEREFKTVASLRGAKSYTCLPYGRRCGKPGKLCTAAGSCPHQEAVARCKSELVRLMHPMTLLSHRKKIGYPEVLIIDEAHKLVAAQRESLTLRLWRSDEMLWPLDLSTHVDLIRWIDHCDRNAPHPIRDKARKLLLDKDIPVIVDKTKELYRGQQKDVLKIIPLSASKAAPTLWPPKKVKVVILMSATISPKDVHELGLDRFHQVAYLDCESPIPPVSRPLHFMPFVDASYKNRELSIPQLAAYINQLLQAHVTEAGFVHATYAEAELLRPYLTSPRFMWHDRTNKEKRLAEFRADGGRSARVFIGSGLTEGVDLAGPVARWQVLTSIPFGSLADPATVARSRLDPESYADDAIKALVQAYGRICRTPTDYGVTYLFDARFKQLYDEYEYLFPAWFRDAIRWS